jgi:2'-5' RNA ligase
VARIFVAVWPPDVVADALAALPRPTVAGVRWVPRDNLHVTLRFLGDADPDEVATRLRDAELPPSSATLGPAVSMLGRRVVMAPVAGLDPLAAAVIAATADLGRPAPTRPFVGHVTLARCTDDRAGRRVCGAAVDAVFPIEQLAVVGSETHPDGARYTTLAAAPVT